MVDEYGADLGARDFAQQDDEDGMSVCVSVCIYVCKYICISVCNAFVC